VNLDESNTASAQMIQLKNGYQEILAEIHECNQENAGTYAREMLYLKKKQSVFKELNLKQNMKTQK
jgi:hypothetical protein